MSTRILLLSDTHGHMDEAILKYAAVADEIWHAGDIGRETVIDQLEQMTTFRGVYGNIDSHEIRLRVPLDQVFTVNGLKVFMTHIGGYHKRIIDILKKESPGLYICGHSHILKVMRDPKYDLLHMNPGACGHHGVHPVRTMLQFEVNAGMVKRLNVIELGRRGSIQSESA